MHDYDQNDKLALDDRVPLRQKEIEYESRKKT